MKAGTDHGVIEGATRRFSSKDSAVLVRRTSRQPHGGSDTSLGSGLEDLSERQD